MTSAEILWRTVITVAVVGLVVFALSNSAYDFRFDQTWDYRWSFLRGLGVTLAATALAYVLGLVLGVVVALARMSNLLVFRHLGDLYVELVRGTPFIVQVSIAWWGVASQIEGLDNRFLVGTLALGVFAAAYMGEIIRAGVESVNRRQFEAARSLGLSRRQCLRHVVFPQAFKRMIPPMTGELIALTKESSLLFTIGVAELMAAGDEMGANTTRNFEGILIVAVLYLCITIPLSMLARRIERRLGKSARGGIAL